MKEFAYGTQAQFDNLEQLLSDGQCHVYHNCILPEGCTPKTTRLGFEKQGDVYILYIDKNISCTIDNPEFRQLLERGETKFICLEDMISFLHSLQPLFPMNGPEMPDVPVVTTTPVSPPCAVVTQPATNTTAQEEDDEPAVDKEKLREIRAETAAPKTVWPEEIAQRLKKVVFGQDEVINELSKKVVINRMRQDKKLLTIALMGPTGTGKSETGRRLADVLSEVYETPFGFININGNQMVGDHSVHSFFGAPPGYVGYGKPTLLEPVRKNPNHVIMIDEIEKSNETLLVGLMEAIDKGVLDMADNSAGIDLNSCILLFTSNIPVDMKAYREASSFERNELCRDAFTKHCKRPEISGKIGNFLVFDSLHDEARADVIIKFIRQELRGYNLRLKTVDPHLMNDFISHETSYGARPLMALVSDALGEQLLAKRMLETLKGKRVSMRGTIDNIEFEVIEGGQAHEEQQN